MHDSAIRRTGAAVALAICGVVAVAGFLVEPPEGAVVGLLGLPGSLLIAAWIAPTVASSTRSGAIGIGIFVAGFGAVLVGDLIVSALLAAGAVADPARVGGDLPPIFAGLALPVAFIAALVGLAVLGAFFGGPLAAVVAVPCGIAWALLVRWLATTGGGPPAEVARRRRAGRAWLVGLAGGFAVGASLPLLGGLGLVLAVGLVAAAAASRPRLPAVGGVVLAIPVGAWLLLWRASAACDPSSCRPPDLSFWAVLIVVGLVAGALLSTIALIATDPGDRPAGGPRRDQGGDAPRAA